MSAIILNDDQMQKVAVLTRKMFKVVKKEDLIILCNADLMIMEK